VSKAAADLMVQEYGRYFGMPTACFRGGCLTGPLHAGARLHGFLSYLMKCAVSGERYVIYGYGGKQVRDNIHADDVAAAFAAYAADPRAAAVYNLGGGRDCNCSVLEAIEICERITGRPMEWALSDEARTGDHRWWVSDIGELRRDYPDWDLTYGLEDLLQEIHDENAERWAALETSG
jgi:CDP-paratose 2-epimerase